MPVINVVIIIDINLQLGPAHECLLTYQSLHVTATELHDYGVSREEFESLQKELNYWQNITITILKKYLIDNEGKVIQKYQL